MSEPKYVKILDKYDATVIEERYNPLIGRLEVSLKVVHVGQGTPSRGLLKVGVAKLYNRDPSLVYVKKVESKYGSSETVVQVHVYDNIERAKKFEPEHIVKRDEESLKKVSQ